MKKRKKYKKDFDPKRYRLSKALPRPGLDIRDGSVYVYQESIKFAVRVGLATGRPLLLFGPPGSGKSSLAAFVARSMNWNYFEQVITSKTRLQDLLWNFDAIRRLRDAQADELYEQPHPYIEPRVLWWAFNPMDAKMRGAARLPENVKVAKPPGVVRGADHPSVVLLDEIDKADPDVPNDLLVALGSQRFKVDDLGREVKSAKTPLVFITSNNERSLPPAFLRRCVIHTLQHPTVRQLVMIAEKHFPDKTKQYKKIFSAVAKKIVDMRDIGEEEVKSSPPSTAEYLDAVSACINLKVKPGENDLWKAINAAVLKKKTPQIFEQ